MVSLALMKDLDISFVEAGLIERIRYFSDIDQNGSGWCFVGKLRLADEFGMSKVGLLKAIQRLIERNILIKNEKGWLMVNQEGLTKLTGQLSLPVNKVCDRGKQSIPNNILKEDIYNIDIIDSYSKVLLSKQSLPQSEQSLSVNKVNPPIKTKPTKSTYYPDDPFFIEQMALKGKRSCAKIGAPWVFLTDQNYHELIEKFKHEELVKEMIKEYSGYKERKSLKARKPTLTLDDKDVAGISASWVEVNAIKVLQARNSPVIAEIRKKEKMKEKFNQK
jgi:hypothetical protein